MRRGFLLPIDFCFPFMISDIIATEVLTLVHFCNMFQSIVNGRIPRACRMLFGMLFDKVNKQNDTIAVEFIDFVLFCYFFHFSNQQECILIALGFDVFSLLQDFVHEQIPFSKPIVDMPTISNLRKLFQNPNIIIVQKTNIINSRAKKRYTLNAHAPCKAGIFFGVNTACF